MNPNTNAQTEKPAEEKVAKTGKVGGQVSPEAIKLQQNIQVRSIQINTLIPVLSNVESTIALLEKRNTEDNERFAEAIGQATGQVGAPKVTEKGLKDIPEEKPAEEKTTVADAIDASKGKDGPPPSTEKKRGEEGGQLVPA